MSLLRYIDTGKSFEEIKDLIKTNPKVLTEHDEFLNPLARAAINLDDTLVDYLISFNIDWDFENTFCYVLSTIAYIYNNVPEHQKEKIHKIFTMLVANINIASENITRCFDEVLYRSNVYLLKLFVENGYFDTRDLPNCEPSIYFRLKYLKELRNRQ